MEREALGVLGALTDCGPKLGWCSWLPVRHRRKANSLTGVY